MYVKIDLPYDAAIQLLGMYPNEMKWTYELEQLPHNTYHVESAQLTFN